MGKKFFWKHLHRRRRKKGDMCSWIIVEHVAIDVVVGKTAGKFTVADRKNFAKTWRVGFRERIGPEQASA